MGMSAVEILEWMRNSDNMIILFGSSVDYTLVDYTPQEIVNRIEKYEAEKNLEDYDEETCKSHCRISAISDSDCADYCNMKCPHVVSEENHIADADKKVEQEFNVGDWVYHRKFGLGKITDVYANSVIAYSVRYGGDRAWDKERLEHAEPPKEEKDCEDCKHYAKDQYSVPCCFCVSHHEKFEPKEEKQKIEKLEVYYDGFAETQMKINELVNAVNELRGVEDEYRN